MNKSSLRVGLQVLGAVLACTRLQANDLFVAPDGMHTGPGTLSQPYDLATALSGQVGQPGDTFWLRGGDYKLGHLNTKLHGARGKPVAFRPVPGEKARVDGSITIFDSIGYVVFRDFELYSSDTNRVSSQTGVGFNVTDIRIIPGIASFAPNLSFINLVIHDQTRHGIYLYQGSTNTLIYGCLVFNNGWVSPDNAEGHGFYVQGEVGTRTLADNIVFNNSGANMHVYENASGKRLVGVTLDGNVAFNAGAIQNVRVYRDWIVGVDAPARYADRVILKNNMGYLAPGLSVLPEVQIGRDSTNGSVTLTDNYMPLGLRMNNWRTAVVLRNMFAPSPANAIVRLNQTAAFFYTNWKSNAYTATDNNFLLNSHPHSFLDWQVVSHLDQRSTFALGALTGTRVFIRTNRFEPRRANIIVYNWANLDSVPVDVNAVLPAGAAFELRNAQDFLGSPVLSGVADGRPLQLPMTGLTVAAPTGPFNGPLRAAPPTGPTFNVFVLLPR